MYWTASLWSWLLFNVISSSLFRLQALRDLLESVAQAEDIVKVHEARLMEKETTSLLPSEVDDYMLTLKVFYKRYYMLLKLCAKITTVFPEGNWSFNLVFHVLHVSKKKSLVNNAPLASCSWDRIPVHICARLSNHTSGWMRNAVVRRELHSGAFKEYSSELALHSYYIVGLKTNSF